ncbi:MAG TPA: alpha-mannosidase [Terriglobales bacterium]|nr:alpha-mannosidase [Terriglobales bacterium]
MKQPLSVIPLFVFFLVSPALVTAGFGQENPAAPASDPYKASLDRLESLVTVPTHDWRFHADVPHPEDPALNDADWQTVRARETWNTGPRVLRRWIEIPEQIHGYSTRGSRVALSLVIRSRDALLLTVFVNGAVVYRGNEDMQEPILLTASAQAGQKVLVAVRIHCAKTNTEIFESQLTVEPVPSRPDPSLLRLEILSAQPVLAAYEDGKAERAQQLDAAVKAIDFAPLEHGDQAGFDRSLSAAQAKLEPLKPWLRQFNIHAVGNSHIDMAWLWPWTETVEVVRNTFQSVLDLMREYPDFKFTMSSARAYEWMEEKYPDLFEEIRQRVREGRWEVIGGMWVEPDLNMPDGESLTRQILVGKRYFQSRFGVDVKIGWNPDSFGYNWQLPQIYKKSGMDYFVTQKLLWAHEFTTFPYKLFWWQAPDGSRLLTYFPHDYAGGIDGVSVATDLSVWAPSIYGSKLSDTPEMMHLYGVGDHGGGPTRQMLDHAALLMSPKTVYPRFELGTATGFFQDLEGKLGELSVPTWNGELYFQYHRGVFTTQAETKRRIRRSEETLLDAEKFASLALLEGQYYPQEEMTRAWKQLLFDHFHDIMPGSGIGVNYWDARQNLKDVRLAGNEVIRKSVEEIAAHINTTGEGVPLLVTNSLAWPRTEVLEVAVQLPDAVEQVAVTDAAGKPAETQLLSIDRATHRARLLLRAHVPALGYGTYFVRGVTQAPERHSELKASTDRLENEFVRVKIDPRTGCMTSLFDKRSNQEALAPAETDTGGAKNSICGNLLQAFVDQPTEWDAWNIDADFEKRYWDLDHADEVKLTENGPLRAVVRVKKHFQNSTFVQDVTLDAGAARVDVNMQVEWHEKHILLKVAFPVSAHSDKASFEIPYGSVERPTTRNTPAEQAQFEVPALRWADISDEKHGLSLLNNCRYGYDAKGNVLRLSLLRSPTWPDPHADEGHHAFTYAIYPHVGTWREARTVREGYELNYKLRSTQVEKHGGALPAEQALVQVDAENVVLTALKKAEDDDRLVFRFYEWAGRETNVRVQLPPGSQAAQETDLMERPMGELSIQEGAVQVHTKPYEIRTVEVRFGLPEISKPKQMAK